MIDYISFIKKNELGVIYTDKSFKQLTTLKIGGNIKLLFYPSTIENFIMFYKYYVSKNNNYNSNSKLNLIVIGNGSNILASSKDYNGIVVCFKNIKYKYSLCNNILTTSSGVMIMDIINYLKKRNLGGFEKLSYIPATIGGMVKMNAGAYNTNISDNLLWVKIIDNNGKIKKLYKNDINFNYRTTNINGIILECCFYMNYIIEDSINRTINFIKQNRKEKQPIECYNAGSTFKNINNIYIWKLIDDIGLRGYNINDAMVSNKHCNFLINRNNCHSDDMIELIELIKNKVYNKYSINIECEWVFINF